jgi:localization factor PodJL
MTRAVRRTKKDMDFDARDAVREAAERAGLSVAEWIDRVVTSYADQMGFSAFDIDDDFRREAISKRIEMMARNSARESLRRSDFDLLDLVQERPKRRRSRSVDSDDDLISSRIDNLSRRAGGLDSERSLHTIEDQLARLTDRMDRLVSGQSSRSEERNSPRPRQDRDTTRSIDDAIAQIARRQNDLSHERAGNADGAPLSWALKEEIANLARRIEETRTEFSQSSLSRAVEERIDQLATRIDEVMKEISGKLTTPKHDLANLQALQNQIAQLSERVERSDLSADGFSALQRTMVDLFRYVEDMRAASLEQAKRTEEQSQELLVLRTLEDHLAALNERVGRSDIPQQGLAAVEATLAELFQHVEDTRQAALEASHKADNLSQAEMQAFQTVQIQIQELAERVYRTEHHFSALGSIEQGMSALFQEFRSSQAAAAQIAEQAVKDALKSQYGDGTGLHTEIEDLRKSQNESERRTHKSLTSIHQTLDRVVDRIAIIEEGGAQAGSQVASHMRAHSDQPPSLNTAAAHTEHAYASGPPPIFAAADDAGSAQAAPLIHVDPSDHGELIEPGHGFMSASQAEPRVEMPAIDEQANFIAAARKSSGHKPLPRVNMTIADDPEDKPNDHTISKLRSLVSVRKLLIAATGIAVLIGAEQALQPDTNLQMSGAISPVVHSPQLAVAPPPKTKTNLTADQTASIPPAQQQSNVTRGSDSEASNALSAGSQNYTEQAARVPFPLLREAAQNGNSAAQYELANRMTEGRGIAKDLFAAAMWYEKAALQNLPPAQYSVGTLYEKGLGVAKDARRARDWYQRAADLGNVRAMHNLAALYADGVDGKPDYSTAAIWFRRAAEYGVRDSQYNLAILYGRGLGIELSLPQAYAWFALAAQQGDDEAGRKRDEVAARLDQKQLTTGKTLVATFRARTPDLASNEVIPQGGWDALKADSKSPKAKVSRVIN